MSHFEFVIPLQREELCNSSAGEYKVEDVLVLEKLEKAITGKTACSVNNSKNTKIMKL